MPLADFSGRRNWGYDGVLLYAPDSAYGRPNDLKALIDAAHLRGLMVFLDVVYNHFGPEGNYLSRYAPAFFDDRAYAMGQRRSTIASRKCAILPSAMRCIGCEHYRFDGLRLDAVHAIVEPGRPPILEELSRAVGELSARVRPDAPPRAGKRRQPRAPARSAHQPAARQISRAVERRLPPRLARAADRRTQGLLPGLRLRSRPAYCTRARVRLRLPGRGVGSSQRPAARRTVGRVAAGGVRQFSAEPRPDRQPAVRRSPVHASRRGGARGRDSPSPCSPRCRR